MTSTEPELTKLKRQVTQLNKRVSVLESYAGVGSEEPIVENVNSDSTQVVEAANSGDEESTQPTDSQSTGGSKIGGVIVVIIGILLILTGLGILLGVPLLIWGIYLLNKSESSDEASEDSSSSQYVPSKEETEKSFEFSFDIVIQWFSRIGIFALLIGFIFAVYYAIREGWISPVVQVVSGIFIGLILLFVGQRLSSEKTQSLLSSLLCGGGIAIVYFMTLATYSLSYYRDALQMTLFVNSLLLVLVAVSSIAFSLWFDKKELVLESYALSYLNLLFFGTFHPIMMFYAFLIGITAFIVTQKKEWYLLGSLNVLLLFVLYLFWATTNTLWFESTFIYLTACFLISIYYTYVSLVKVPVVEIVFQYLLSGFFYVVFMYIAIAHHFPSFTELFMVVVGIIYFLLAMMFYKRCGNKDNLLTDASMYSSLGLLTLALALYVDAKFLSFFLLIEFVLLTRMSVKSEKAYFLVTSLIISGIILLKLIFFDLFQEVFVFNNSVKLNILLFVASAAAFYWSAYMWKKSELQTKLDVKFSPFYVWVATGLLSLIVLFESTTPVFSTLVLAFIAIILASLHHISKHLPWQSYAIGIVVFFKFLLNDIWATKSLEYAATFFESSLAVGAIIVCLYYILLAQYSKMTCIASILRSTLSWLAAGVLVILTVIETTAIYLTLSWVILAVILFIVGILLNSRHLRIQSLVLLGLVIFKVFLLDLQTLAIEGRIISFVGLGVALLVISYLYGKYKEKFHELFI